MAPFLCSPVVAALRYCGAEGPKREGGLFYGEVPAPHDFSHGGRWPGGPERSFYRKATVVATPQPPGGGSSP